MIRKSFKFSALLHCLQVQNVGTPLSVACHSLANSATTCFPPSLWAGEAYECFIFIWDRTFISVVSSPLFPQSMPLLEHKAEHIAWSFEGLHYYLGSVVNLSQDPSHPIITLAPWALYIWSLILLPPLSTFLLISIPIPSYHMTGTSFHHYVIHHTTNWSWSSTAPTLDMQFHSTALWGWLNYTLLKALPWPSFLIILPHVQLSTLLKFCITPHPVLIEWHFEHPSQCTCMMMD